MAALLDRLLTAPVDRGGRGPVPGWPADVAALLAPADAERGRL
jgi:hypothetical protein